MSKRKHAIEAHFQRGQQLLAAGRPAEAVQVFRQILASAPDHADSVHMMGVVGLQAGQPAAALSWLDQAIRLRPTAALYLANRANALLALGRPAEAEAAAREALRHKRNSAEAWQTLGHALSDQGQAEAAIAAQFEAVKHNARLPGVQESLGLALQEASRLEDAEAAFRDAVKRMPGDRLALGNLAGVLKDMGRLVEAEAIYRDILRRNPDDAAAHLNLGVLLLLDGRVAEGWEQWEWRFAAEPGTARGFPQPRWNGEPLAGRTLLVHAEQGLGDMIQFCRFLPLVTGGRVVLEVHPPLVRLLSQLPGLAAVVALGDKLPAFDVTCPMMSLPRAFHMADDADIPSAQGAYLHADPTLVERWQRRLAGVDGLRVGVAWGGSAERVRLERRRAVPLEALAGLAEVPGVRLVSLQKGPAAAALAGSPLAGRMLDLGAELGDFADTAGLMETLDLVVSVDTAVAHLAGALSKPVWLLNRADTCWRWRLGRDDSAWYPSLRQFRQERAGDWSVPIARLCDALAGLAASHATSEAPV